MGRKQEKVKGERTYKTNSFFFFQTGRTAFLETLVRTTLPGISSWANAEIVAVDFLNTNFLASRTGFQGLTQKKKKKKMKKKI